MKSLFRNPFRAHVDAVAKAKAEEDQKRSAEEQAEAARYEQLASEWQSQKAHLLPGLTDRLAPILEGFVDSLDVGAPIIKVGGHPGSITFSVSAANDDGFLFSVSAQHKYDPESRKWNLSLIEVSEGSLYPSLGRVFPQDSAKIKHLLILLAEIVQAVPEVPVELALERVNTLVLKGEMEKFTHPGVTLKHDTLVQFFSVEGHVSYDIVIATTSVSEE